MTAVDIQQPFGTFKLISKVLTRQRVKLDEFQPLTIRLNDVSCSAEQRAAFKVFFNTQIIPPSFLFNVSYRYLGQLLSQAKIPSKLMGLIHLSSDYYISRQVDWHLPYDLILSLVSFEQSKKGLIYQIKVSVVQAGYDCLDCTNQILDKDKDYKNRAPKAGVGEHSEGIEIASQSLTTETSIAYAKLSGDYNPIHLSHSLAKLLGMKSVVMHGMYNLHWSLTNLTDLSGVTQINASFNQPCYLPRKVTLIKSADNAYDLFSNNFKNRHLRLIIQ